MSTIRKAFRVNNCHDFVMDFKTQSDGTIKIFVPIHPPDPHGKHASAHHLMDGGYICVASGSEPRSIDRAIAIGKYWAEKFSAYVITGTFSDTGAKVQV